MASAAGSPVEPSGYVPRIVDAALDELIGEAPAIMLTGPRACGKTTTARRRAATVVRLDSPGESASYRSDPDAALRRATPPVLLDEWQAVPEILPAVKRAVDDDPTPGRFLLTGSMRSTHAPELWPGTGRLARVRMYGMTHTEVLGTDHQHDLVSRLSGGVTTLPEPEIRYDLPGYLGLAVRGGMPATTVGVAPARPERWYADYLDQFLDRDLRTSGQVVDADRMRRYLATLAECSAGLPTTATMTAAAGINARTMSRYDDILTDLGILDLASAWTSNRLRRLISRPKVYLTETGLVAAALQTDVDDLLSDPDLFGRMLDTFVAAQLRPELAVDLPPRRLHHLRDADGRHEVDIVIDLGRRGILAVEVKASASVSANDARHLIWLREQLGDRFVAGVVFHTGPASFELDERITAAPISALWAS